MTIHLGCQSYTWQMSHDRYKGEIPHILDIVAKAQFEGFEPEVCMLGDYDDPVRMKEQLDRRGLKLGALCLALPWRQSAPTEEEHAETVRTLRFLKQFPGTLLVLVQLPGKDRRDLRDRQRNLINNIIWTSELAAERGIVSAFHPNSPPGSIIRIQEDYDVFFDGISGTLCGYAPDTGHIQLGGMDVETVLKKYRSLIRHVHFKDIDAGGEWTAMGSGVIDHEAIVAMLRDTDYDGWIMVEEESKKAEMDPDIVTLENGRYVAERLAAIAAK